MNITNISYIGENMKLKIEQFFNSLQREQFLENKRYIKRKYKGRVLGRYPTQDINISDFDHFMECEVSPDICPLKWENLHVDFTDKNRRFCEYCKEYVYKVDNETMYKKLKEENKCVAISYDLLQKINKNFDDDKFRKLQDRLKISMFFLVFKNHFPSIFREIAAKTDNYKQILKESVNYILSEEESIWTIIAFIEKKVDLDFIFNTILPKIDEEFYKSISKKLYDLLEFYDELEN